MKLPDWLKTVTRSIPGLGIEGQCIKLPSIVCGISKRRYPRAFSLDLPYYQQTTYNSCGYVAGLTVLHYFFPDRSPKRLLGRVNLTEYGIYYTHMIRAVRRSGLTVQIRYQLSFEDLASAIDQGWPVIVEVKWGQIEHYVVLGGYQRRPRYVFLWNHNFEISRLWNNGWKYSPDPIPWGDFCSVWINNCGYICHEKT